MFISSAEVESAGCFFNRLQSAAIAKFESVRMTSATGLLYAIDQQKFTDINVHIHPTCIIVPSKGVYREYVIFDSFGT